MKKDTDNRKHNILKTDTSLLILKDIFNKEWGAPMFSC